jgi:glycosyltransferase involved in cell wall biosynthesis
MNILFLIHRYPPALGGSERYIQEMARRLVREGHAVTVYTSDQLEVEGFWQRGCPRLPAGLEDDEGVVVHRFRAHALPMHGAVSRLLGLLPFPPLSLAMAPPGLVVPDLWQAVRAGGSFDLVHASAYPSLMYLGAAIARRAGARLVLMPCNHPGTLGHGPGWLSPRGSQLARLYGQADAMIALTEWERDIFVQAGVSPERITVTGAGVHPEAARDADASRFRRKFGLPAEGQVVTFIGHKTMGKGALHLLEACRPLLNQRPDLTVVTGGTSTRIFDQHYGALPKKLKRRILNIGLSEEDKHSLLAASSVLVLPSRDDSFGIVFLEAWLHGKPVIGARAGGISAVIEQGRTGLLVPYGDVQALAEAIGWVLDHPAEAAQMGTLGQQRTLEHWTWGAVYQRLQSAYGPLLPTAGGE